MNTFYRFILFVSTMLIVASSCEKRIPIDDKNVDPKYRSLHQFFKSIGTMPKPEADRNIETIKKSDTVDVGELPLDLSENSMTSYNKVTQQVDVNYISNLKNFAVFDEWTSVLWPGCLVKGLSLNRGDEPDAIPLVSVRKPGRIYFSFASVGGTAIEKEQNCYEDIEQMTVTNVLDAKNRFLSKYLLGEMPAQTSMTIERVYSYEDMLAKAGVNISYAKNHFYNKFGKSFIKEHSYYLVKIIQTYYTLSYATDGWGYASVFKPETNADDLRLYTGNGNPMCVVSSVSYGRAYYLLCESDLDYRGMSSALHFSLANKLNVSDIDIMDYNTMASKVKVNMLHYGGNAKDGFEGAMKLSKVGELIKKSAKFDNNNVGVPISFVVKNLYDNSIVRLGNTLKYSYDKVSYIPKGKDEVSLFVKNINFSISEKDGYTASNRGHIKLDEIKISCFRENNIGNSFDVIYLSDKYNSLKYDFDIPIYKQKTFEFKDNIQRILVLARGEIKSESYKRNDIDTNPLYKFDISVTFEKNADGSWKVSSGDNRTTNEAFNYVLKQITIGKLDFVIRMNYDFILDGVIVKNHKAKK